MTGKGITSPLFRDLIRPAPAWTLDASRSAPATARRLVADQLAAWHLGCLADDVLLVVSELVTNAIRTDQAVRLAVHAAVSAGRRILRIEVTSPGTGPHTASPVLPDANAEHGRGLPIVEALTDAWGCDHYTGYTLVWAQIALPAPAHAVSRDRLATAA